MRMIMFCRLFWPHGGGVERHVEGLSRELIKRGHEITVITEQYQTSLMLSENIKGVNLIRIPHSQLNSKLRVWQWMGVNRGIINDVDLIHLHDVFWWYIPLSFYALNKPLYTTFHGYEGSKPPRWQAVVHRKIAEKLSKKTICVGDFMRRWYYAKPDLVTYGAANAVSTPVPSSKIIVFVGRLEEDTGIVTYLKIIEFMGRKYTLDVYGSGSESVVCQDLINKGHLSVAMHGWTNDPIGVIVRCRWAFTSRYLAILEAMQTKRLVVAVYNNEIKKDYLMCHPMAKNMIIGNDPKVIAKRLMNLDEKTESEMVERAYRWARLQTWEKLADQYEQLWGLK